MEDVNFLSGKVVKRTLPCLAPTSGADLPAIKRLVLPQGELAQFHDSGLPIHYIAALELRTGTVRGNHYHVVKVEHVYLMHGQLELIVQEPGSNHQTTVTIDAGDLVVIQPGVVHAFRVTEPGVAIEFAPTRFDPADVHRVQLI